MNKLLIYILYYIGHITYLLGMKYWYIPGAYSLYNKCMCKSAELDVGGIVWGKPLDGPEKDEV